MKEFKDNFALQMVYESSKTENHRDVKTADTSAVSSTRVIKVPTSDTVTCSVYVRSQLQT